MPILNTFSGGGGGIRIPLEAPTGFSATVSDGTISFTWTDPVDKVANPGGELVSEWNYTLVVRKVGSAPLTPTDGYQVLRTTSRNQHAGIPFVDTGLDNDVTYYYAIYAYSTLGVPSEALNGNATPTYFASISYTRSLSTGFSVVNDSHITAAGGNGAMAIYTLQGRGERGMCYFDTQLSRKTLTPVFSDYRQPVSSARVGNYAIFCGKETFSVDGNAAQSLLGSGAFPNSNNIISAADVDHKVAYAFGYPSPSSYSGTTRNGYRYDSNLTVTSIGALPSSASWVGKSLSSKYYAVIVGFSTSSSNAQVGYYFNKNGTRSQANTPLCQGENVATSRCDEYMLIYGGSEESGTRFDSDEVYAISKDLVVTHLGNTPNSGAFSPFDAQTNGLGIAFHFQYNNNNSYVAYYDKHLVAQGNVSGFPTNVGNLRYDGLQCPRVGQYVLAGSTGLSTVYALENA